VEESHGARGLLWDETEDGCGSQKSDGGSYVPEPEKSPAVLLAQGRATGTQDISQGEPENMRADRPWRVIARDGPAARHCRSEEAPVAESK